MDTDLFIKIFGFFISLIVPLKFIYDRGDSKRRNLSHDFEITKNFFEYIQSIENIHPLVIERGYHAIANDNTVSISEIEHLLLFEKPFFAIDKYLKCRDLLNFDNKQKLHFRIFFKNAKFRFLLKSLCAISYFLFAFFAIFIASIILFTEKSTTNIAYNFLILFPASCFLAYKSIQGFVLVKNSEQLLEMQHNTLLKNPLND